MDKALGLLTKMCESMGAMQGKILKEQAGAEALDVKAAWSLVKSVPVGIGIGAEVIKESQQEIVIRAGKCPLSSAGQMPGFDNKTMETMCRKGSSRLMDTMTRELNPNLTYQLRKFRSGADDFCEEAIIHNCRAEKRSPRANIKTTICQNQGGRQSHRAHPCQA